MEFEFVESHGWLANEITVAMTPDELAQLRFAVSIAVAHGVNQPIFHTFLALTDHL